VLVQTVGVLTIATVCGSAAGLNVGDAIRGGSEDAKERFGVHCAGTDFDIVRLLKNATLVYPEMRKLEN
jgi:hypothetical protein